MDIQQLLKPINAFLCCPTPSEWLNEAIRPENLPVLLIDHANCELKAAQTAMLLLRKYAVDQASSDYLLEWLKPYEDFVYRKVGSGDFSKYNGLSKKLVSRTETPHSNDIVDKMVLLIKEELHHFQQVCGIMNARNIDYDNLTASRYARGMMRQVRTYEPAALIDKLICGAYIEARSCERFAALAPYVDDELSTFYISLLRSEARHFEDYLSLAQSISQEPIEERVKMFGEIEAELITSADEQFRFHSGVVT